MGYGGCVPPAAWQTSSSARGFCRLSAGEIATFGRGGVRRGVVRPRAILMTLQNLEKMDFSFMLDADMISRLCQAVDVVPCRFLEVTGDIVLLVFLCILQCRPFSRLLLPVEILKLA